MTHEAPKRPAIRTIYGLMFGMDFLAGGSLTEPNDMEADIAATHRLVERKAAALRRYHAARLEELEVYDGVLKHVLILGV
jgi:hypothetical protein